MEQIKRMYERQKRGRIKAVIVCVIVYFLMTGIVSLFYGNPFSHKEVVLFFEMEQRGWIYTHGYLLLLCGIAGLAACIGSVIYRITNDYRVLDRILLQECDVKKYLELMECAVSYGKKFSLKGFQGTVFVLAQQKYVLALSADWKSEEAQNYLEVGWKGNKNTRLYKQTVMNFNLIKCYITGNRVGFQEIFMKSGKIFEKNKLFIAEKLFLEEQYEKAAGVLSAYKEKKLYNEVSRNYLLGRCYDRLGNRQLAEEHMRYTVANGNTMPCREKAKEWLLTSSLKLLEQKGELWCGGENIGE